MKRAFVLTSAVLVLLAVSAQPAEANIWDVLEQLSGPGPFHSRGNVLVSGGCVQPQVPHLGIDSRVPARAPCWFFDLRRFHADADEFFRAVDAQAYDFGATFQVRRPIELGFGMGLIHFSSNGVNTTKVTTTPLRVVVKPLLIVPKLRDKKWAGVVKYYVRESVIWGRLTQDDFGISAARHVFNEKNDVVTSAGFLIDLGELIPR